MTYDFYKNTLYGTRRWRIELAFYDIWDRYQPLFSIGSFPSACIVLSPNMCPFLYVAEVYIGWIEIAYSLMRSFVVPVVNEFLMGFEHPGFTGVGFVEGFYLSYG